MQNAHAGALEAAGILSRAERESLDHAVSEIGTKFTGQPCPTSDAEDLHTWVEGELVKRCGDTGKKIHTGRSRNDQVATLIRLFVIDAGERASTATKRLVEIACRRAIAWSDMAMPMQTHQQFAAPGNAGFWIMKYATAFDRVRRHWDGIGEAWRRGCPLGSGAVAGSSIGIDRGVQARALSFQGPSLNALDSTSTRDDCLEFLFIASQAALHLQSLATDVIVFSQTPLAWTKYPTEFGTGSSMMPNKMNPDAMELLRGEANAIIAAHVQAMLLMKGLPSGYNRDLQCIKPIVRDAAEKLHALLELAAAFLERLEFDRDRLAASMKQGAIEATLRMEQLVKEGKPLRDAHHAVAEEVAKGTLSLAGAPMDWANQYVTSGSASPAETRRTAEALLKSLA